MNNDQWLQKLKTVTTEVTKIDYLNKYYPESDKIKSAFYCKGNKKDRLCIYWKRTSSFLDVGDQVTLTGYIKQPADVFMIDSLIIKKKVINGE